MGKRVLSMPPVTKSSLFRLFRMLLLLYVALCGLLWAFQRALIYHPVRRSETEMMTQAAETHCEPWKNAAGAIIGWKSVREKGRPIARNRLVVFDGNTGYALNRNYYRHGFERLENGEAWEVYLLEYPGYGAREGAINEASFIDAGEQALTTLAATDPRPIYLLGESLGSGLACALAQRHPESVAGVFLVTPYARMGDVAANRFGFFPVRLMLRDSWDNVAALKAYHGPVAILIAGEDEVVTAAQGRLLYQGYAGPKHLWTDPDAGHNSIDFSPDAPWWSEVSDFLQAHPSPRLSLP